MSALEVLASAGSAQPKLLSPVQAAQRLGVSVNTLARRRSEGLAPAYIALSPKSVRYSEADIEAFIEASRRTPRAS